MILKEPEHADALAEFARHFGMAYRSATLCAAAAAVIEKLLRPKRAAFSGELRGEVFQAQGHRCAGCDAELRVGEDHGDHVDVVRHQVALNALHRPGQPPRRVSGAEDGAVSVLRSFAGRSADDALLLSR